MIRVRDFGCAIALVVGVLVLAVWAVHTPRSHFLELLGLLSNRLTSFTRDLVLGEDVRHAEVVSTGVEEGRGYGCLSR